MASDPDAGWVFVVDQLNTHQSETLVRLVATLCGITAPLGIKGTEGTLPIPLIGIPLIGIVLAKLKSK